MAIQPILVKIDDVRLTRSIRNLDRAGVGSTLPRFHVRRSYVCTVRFLMIPGSTRFFARLMLISPRRYSQQAVYGVVPCCIVRDIDAESVASPPCEQRRAMTTERAFAVRETVVVRVTPPSVRFLGRKHFLSSVVLLVSAARYGARPRVVQALRHTYDVSHSTLARWQRWWRETVPTTAFWLVAKTRVSRPIDPSRVPAELVKRFEATAALENLIAALRFIATLPCELVAAPNNHDIFGSRSARRV